MLSEKEKNVATMNRTMSVFTKLDLTTTGSVKVKTQGAFKM